MGMVIDHTMFRLMMMMLQRILITTRCGNDIAPLYLITLVNPLLWLSAKDYDEDGIDNDEDEKDKDENEIDEGKYDKDHDEDDIDNDGVKGRCSKW